MSSFCLNISQESPPVTGLDMLYITLSMNRESISNYEINPCEYNKVFQKYSTAILAFSMCGFFCDFTQDDASSAGDDASSAGDDASSAVTMPHRQVTMPHRQVTMSHRQVTMSHRQVMMTHRQVMMTHRQVMMTHRQVMMTHNNNNNN
jgi:hypothetical protein